MMRTTNTVAISALQQIANLKNLGYTKNVLLHAIAEIYDEQAQVSRFKTWMTLVLGTGLKTGDEFHRALQSAGHNVSTWADNMLHHPAFTAATEKTEVELVRVTVAELGFKNGATRKDIYCRAQKFGLELCTVEVGPQLRLQYKDQPMNEWLLIAMEPISDSGGFLRVWRVGRSESGSWLYSSYGEPSYFRVAGFVWVFVRRK